MLENVQGLASAKFKEYRDDLLKRFSKMGYDAEWRVLQASDFGVPQLRPRFILVALRPDDMECTSCGLVVLHWHLPLVTPSWTSWGANGWLWCRGLG